MKTKAILVTGSNGEIGHGLLPALAEREELPILSLDLSPLDPELEPYCQVHFQADILQPGVLQDISQRYTIPTIYHLASILSTSAERNPQEAHRVNVEGTLLLLQMALDHTGRLGNPVTFLYPSSIAVYGLPDLSTKNEINKVEEQQWCCPTTMYGCNKLYCEHLGRYYATSYAVFSPDEGRPSVDFRALRFPGLISADTVPTGGTSDYGPEMLHHAAQGKPYQCFVRPDSRLPFMAMPDAVNSLLQLEAIPAEHLTRHVYNVTSFNPSAEEIYQIVLAAFPQAEIRYQPDSGRQAIVDSWPADLDDSAARHDWEWQPLYDLDRAFTEYLIPSVSERYGVRA